MFKYIESDKYLGLRNGCFYDTLSLKKNMRESAFFENIKNHFSRSVGGSARKHNALSEH